jgi:hypothetical protein
MPNPRGANLPNPAEYTSCGDGTVRDDVTGLIWQESVSDIITFDAATNYCQGLALPGGGWRLPTTIELVSLVDFTRSSPAIDVTAFPETPSDAFWSSTEVPSRWTTSLPPGERGVVSFRDCKVSTVDPQARARTRCVRSTDMAAPAQPFAQSDGGLAEVEDTLTALIWEQGHSFGQLDWSGATAYCTARSPSQGWRLPTMKELQTLDTMFVGWNADVTAAAFPNFVSRTGEHVGTQPGIDVVVEAYVPVIWSSSPTIDPAKRTPDASVPKHGVWIFEDYSRFSHYFDYTGGDWMDGIGLTFTEADLPAAVARCVR